MKKPKPQQRLLQEAGFENEGAHNYEAEYG